MSRTFNVSKNSFVGLIETNTQPVKQTEVDEAQSTEPLTASLSEILADSDTAVRSAILDSFMSGLNLSLINQCKQHVLWSPDRPLDERFKGIDAFNERKTEHGEQRFDAMFSKISGGKERMSAHDVATHLAHIRAFCVDQHYRLAPNRDPRPLWESIVFMLDQMPVEVSIADPAIKVIALMTKQSPEVVARMKAEIFANDRQQLTDAAPRIVELAEKLQDQHVHVDEQACEGAFDALPGVTQVNIFTAACNAIVSAYTRAFKRVLRGQAVAAGDMTIAADLHKRAVQYREQLLLKHADAVADYEASGAFVKELKLIP